MIASMRLVVGGVSALALALATAAHLAALGGRDVEALYPMVWWLHIAAIVLVAVALLFAFRLAGAGPHPRPRLRDLLAVMPVWSIVAIAIAFLYVIATFVLLVPATGAGVPVIRDGHFFFNDHGTMREVSADAFHATRAAGVRLFSAVWIYLLLIATVVLLFGRNR